MSLKPRNERVDNRPYVGDSGRELQGPADAATVTFAFIVLALAIGFAIGFIVFAIMNLSVWVTSLIWGSFESGTAVWWYPLAICTLGGLVIGLWTLLTGNRVRGLEEVMREFRETGRYELGGAGRAVVSFLLPLVFGGSVGFEAGLTGIITAACCWIRDRLKAAGLRAAHVANVTISATLSAIFGTPLAGLVAGMESDPESGSGTDGIGGGAGSARIVDSYNMRKGVKVVLYLAAAIGAFGGIILFSSLFGRAAGLPRFDSISASGADLIWVVPCLVIGYLLTVVYHGSSRAFGHISLKLGDGSRGTVMKPVVAGIIMGTLATVFPLVLFPGEMQAHELMADWRTWSALALIATGVLKAIATPMCLRMGWMGGNLFPSIFAGVACGYGVALLTGADPMLMVTVVTTAFLAGVTRKPLLAIAILLLCFPLHGIIWSGIAAVIGGSLPIPGRILEKEELQ
ncbi:MAG: chloride channel protein [Coriobacteriales bacterium]|jgi:H+/Cl- antiporter ClcA